MKLAPVILFVFNRPSHTARTLLALQDNDLADQTDLIIYSDYGKDVKEVRDVCKQNYSFKSVTLVERKENYGLARNVKEGVTEQLKKYGKVIVLEDDLVTGRGFLTYMNEALTKYENTSVASVSGFTRNVTMPKGYPYITYTSPRPCSTGWGTWSNRWDDLAFSSMIKRSSVRESFNKGGDDLSMMLIKRIKGVINSWAVEFAFHCWFNSYKCIYPVKSLLENIGYDGSGTNVKWWSRKVSVEKVDSLSGEFCPDEYNNEIMDNFRKVYNVSVIRRLINFFKIRYYCLT